MNHTKEVEKCHKEKGAILLCVKFEFLPYGSILKRKTFKLKLLFFSMRYWNPEIETMSADLRHEMQSRKLRNMIRQAFNNSPFYRSLFHQNRLDPSDINTMSDLTKIPLTRKEDLIDNPREFILQPNEISLTKTLPLEKRYGRRMTDSPSTRKSPPNSSMSISPSCSSSLLGGRLEPPLPFSIQSMTLKLWQKLGGESVSPQA